MKDRVTILLDRELDGSLSDLERAELERKILLCPDARRDRASWKKVIGELKAQQPVKKLQLDRMASEIAKQASQRPVAIPFKRMSHAVVAATLMAAGFALVALRPPEPVVVQQPVAAIASTGPVEMTIDREDREEEVHPITIRF
jgi:anti-sigma factor RsiW